MLSMLTRVSARQRSTPSVPERMRVARFQAFRWAVLSIRRCGASGRRPGRQESEGDVEGAGVAVPDGGGDGGVDGGLACLGGGFGGVLGVDEHPGELVGPQFERRGLADIVEMSEQVSSALCVFGVGVDVVGAVAVVHDGARVAGQDPNVSDRLDASVGCTAIRVSRLVVRVCIQCFVAPTRVPVSSVWTTGASPRRALRAVMNGTSPRDASCWIWHSHPVDTGTPSTSASSSAPRSTGRYWRTRR